MCIEIVRKKNKFVLDESHRKLYIELHNKYLQLAKTSTENARYLIRMASKELFDEDYEDFIPHQIEEGLFSVMENPDRLKNFLGSEKPIKIHVNNIAHRRTRDKYFSRFGGLPIDKRIMPIGDYVRILTPMLANGSVSQSSHAHKLIRQYNKFLHIRTPKEYDFTCSDEKSKKLIEYSYIINNLTNIDLYGKVKVRFDVFDLKKLINFNIKYSNGRK